MVFDHYEPLFQPFTSPAPLPPTVPTVEGLRRLLANFREAVEAARKVDTLTGQPDCEDPEKRKLEEWVTELERRLDEMTTSPVP